MSHPQVSASGAPARSGLAANLEVEHSPAKVKVKRRVRKSGSKVTPGKEKKSPTPESSSKRWQPATE